MKKENKRIIIILVGFCLMFISLIAYISYFQVFRAQAVKNNSYNKRLWISEESTLRGSFLDRNGKVIVYSEKRGNGYERIYPYSNLYSHVVGYSYREYGKAGLELVYNNALLDINENQAINDIKNIVSSSSVGNNIKLTIDHGLQSKARDLLKGKKGSIIAMNPKTGEIYSMVSMPDFDVSNLRDNWKGITEDPNKPLFNRATQGTYPPGSTFKVITAMAALNKMEFDEEYNCTGITTIDGKTFKDSQEKGHGNINLNTALVKSCNTYFTEKSLIIGKENIGNIAEKFLINNSISFDLPTKLSSFPYKGTIGKTELAAAAIGQGKVLVTPLNMALIASGIANGGEIIKPTLVKEVISKNDRVIRKSSIEALSYGTDPITAKEMTDMMVEVVKSGTGTNAAIKNIKVAGKTGTAENPSGKSHAWFIGFAPADDPRVAVAVVLEEEGQSGGKSAAPIARDIILHTINNIND